ARSLFKLDKLVAHANDRFFNQIPQQQGNSLFVSNANFNRDDCAAIRTQYVSNQCHTIRETKKKWADAHLLIILAICFVFAQKVHGRRLFC
ncbi:MAG TPA: hypothetical protein VK832_18190, partial [Burkholderiaceae bacterium]|nr:hypothetical protein [Burkholderiaceae bacterium]